MILGYIFIISDTQAQSISCAVNVVHNSTSTEVGTVSQGTTVSWQCNEGFHNTSRNYKGTSAPVTCLNGENLQPIEFECFKVRLYIC